MNKTIDSFEAFDQKTRGTFEIEYPNTCPHCSIGIIPTHLISFHIKSRHKYRHCHIYSIFLCPNCENAFMSFYSGEYDLLLTPLRIFPSTSDQVEFSKNISDVSQKFCEIYNESYKAEQNGLLEICGMGYRKALEFLIKDYAIKNNPDKQEEIKKQMLSPCINNYIDNTRIKTLATASAWIGNDETHYCRKHEDYNLESLKAFINAIVSYIDSEAEVLKASNLIKPQN